MAYVDAICISKKKGETKHEIKEAIFIQNYGIKGDAHVGRWHRQVSILFGKSIDSIKERIPIIRNGIFAENLIIRGVDFIDIRVGDRILIGNSVILEITQIGKECHNSCVIKKMAGECIMPTEGFFAKVVSGGKVQKGEKAFLKVTVNSSGR